MKVLLLGDFSGVHLNLFKGLKDIGIDVDLAHDGDGFKNLYRSINLGSKKNNILLRHIDRLYIEQSFLNKVSKYDIVQIMTPSVLSRFHLSNPYKKIIQRCKKVYLLSAGDDYEYWRKFREGSFISRSPHKDTLEIDLKKKDSPWENTRNKFYSQYLAQNVTGIISTADLYTRVYFDNTRFVKKIPFPVIVGERPILNKAVVQNKKLKILLGIQSGREGFKGTRFFEEALKIIKTEYPDLFEIDIVRDVPFQFYQSKLNECDILLDQLNAYEPAMNALIAMSFSKAVVGGWQPEYFIDSDLKILETPMVNAEKSAESIVKKLLELNTNREELYTIMSNAYDYVNVNHSHQDISKKYLDLWSN